MALSRAKKGTKIYSFIVLLLACIIMLIPLLWALSTSLKDTKGLVEHPASLIPYGFTFENYVELFTSDAYPIFAWLGNSLLVATAHTILYLILISLAGYAFGVMEWKGRDVIFWLLLLTMMIPNVVNLIPLFTMIVNFGWFRNLIALIVPGLGGTFGLFIVRSFFLGIPKELIQAAEVDGLSKIKIFFKVVLPLGKSALFVAGLFAFLGQWNDYLWPVLVLSGSQVYQYTLPIGLSLLQGNNNYRMGLVLAGAITSTIPVIVLYCFTQNKIISGVSRTGLK